MVIRESRPSAATETATRTRTRSTDSVTDSEAIPAHLDDTRCRRCRRRLRSSLAVAAGLGPICSMAAIARVPLRVRDEVHAQLALPYPGDEVGQ